MGIDHTDPYAFLTLESRSALRNTTEESISNSRNHHRSLHALQLKKAAFSSPEQSQVRAYVTLEKVRISPRKGQRSC